MPPIVRLILPAAAAVVVACLLLFRRQRRRAGSSAKDSAKAEEGLPHLCRPGTFHVEPSILVRNVSPGGEPHFMHVFEALFCSSCGAELACANCRSTPGNGALLNNEEMRRLTRCCLAPRYRARKPAKLRIVSSPSAGPKGGDGSGHLPN